MTSTMRSRLMYCAALIIFLGWLADTVISLRRSLSDWTSALDPGPLVVCFGCLMMASLTTSPTNQSLPAPRRKWLVAAAILGLSAALLLGVSHGLSV